MRTVLEGHELDNLVKLTKGSRKMAISVRVRSGSIEIFEGSSHLGYCSGTDTISASTDGEIIAGLNSKGQITIYNLDGSYKSTLCGDGFVSVSVSGREIAAQKSDGHTYLYDSNGVYKGTYY